MKIAITDRGTGIMQEFARSIGAETRGRFINIPEQIGEGYITGFSWGEELRMLIRNYHLKEDVFIERTNELSGGQDHIVFLLSGVFPSSEDPSGQLSPEEARLMICPHAVSAIMAMPSHTIFGSVTIAVSRAYLQRQFGQIAHPVVRSVLEAKDNFVLETGISARIIGAASGMPGHPVPEALESQYFRLKCDELLVYIFALLMQREELPASHLHIKDIKAVYAVKARLLTVLDRPPVIAGLAREAGMSEPKLRKLFRQIFGKGIFAYYQSPRMQKAAGLLKDKRLTVSEVGYELGFTNLSHFSRVFEQHHGIKPKKYSLS